VRFSALRSRDFRLLLAGQAVSLTGTQMQPVALVWQLYLLTRSRSGCSVPSASRPSSCWPWVVASTGYKVRACRTS